MPCPAPSRKIMRGSRPSSSSSRMTVFLYLMQIQSISTGRFSGITVIYLIQRMFSVLGRIITLKRIIRLLSRWIFLSRLVINMCVFQNSLLREHIHTVKCRKCLIMQVWRSPEYLTICHLKARQRLLKEKFM